METSLLNNNVINTLQRKGMVITMKKRNKTYTTAVILSAAFMLAGCGAEPETGRTVSYTEVDETSRQEESQ